ncbi:MAG: Fic family protein, partial [Acidobacteriota bacterium]|nr:Fic family protein [Acidobacteriota bacterium]
TLASFEFLHIPFPPPCDENPAPTVFRPLPCRLLCSLMDKVELSWYLLRRMDELLTSVAAKKERLDAIRPFSREALLGLQKFYDIDLTYTSNAIEGNTLTLRETAELIEHGITVGGKSLRDHLEAVDHYNAVLWMRELAAKMTPLDETTVRELHRRIVARSQPEIGGIYSTLPRRIAGSPVVFPNAAKLPQLMKDYGEWLRKTEPVPAASFDAHFRLVGIHPFADGNGRTARLLMNLLLLRGGYPPIAVRPEDRKTYLDTLEQASMQQDLKPFQMFMHQRLDATLGEYLSTLQETLPSEAKLPKVSETEPQP